MLDTEQQQAAMEALDAADVAVEISDARGEIHWVNEAFARMTGWSVDDAVGRTPRELLRSGFHPAEQYAEMWDKLERGAVWRGELVSRGRDDRLFRQVVAVAPVGGSGSGRGFVAVRRDVTAQIRAEQSHRALLDAALDAVLIADLDTARFVDANRAAQEMFGYSLDQLRATTGRMLCTPGQDNLVDAISAELNEHGLASYNQVRLRKADGREFWGDLRMGVFEVAGARSYVTIIRDVSDRVVRERELERSYAQLRETQAKLVHAGKLAAIGQLAAGVAHEINNPASYVTLNLHLALEWLENAREGPLGTELGELQQMLEESLQGIRQIAAISRDLRVFARIERDQRTHVRLREVVEIAARMVRGQIRNDVRLELDLVDGLELLGDAPKLTQVMMNLLVNAAHALEQGRGGDGRIRVVTREVDGLVEIEVEDNGPGIPAELQDRVFEPFFTTKPSGVGTGLGLSVCAEIIRAHEGVMSLTSEPGRGTRFTIRLPMSPAAQAETGADRGEIGRSVGRARILVIDDDALALRAYDRLLRGEFDVVLADCGQVGLEALAHARGFDAVVCDLTMPDMDGAELFERAIEGDPALADRFVFCSGGALTQSVQQFVDRGRVPLLEKPVDPEALRRCVRQLVARPRRSEPASPST